METENKNRELATRSQLYSIASLCRKNDLPLPKEMYNISKYEASMIIGTMLSYMGVAPKGGNNGTAPTE